jgi:hypothetical protein
MRQIGTLALQIEPATTARPTHVSIVVSGAPRDEPVVLHLTPDCLTLDELEGQISTLQDELDLMRAEARRAFADPAGHA